MEARRALALVMILAGLLIVPFAIADNFDRDWDDHWSHNWDHQWDHDGDGWRIEIDWDSDDLEYSGSLDASGGGYSGPLDD